MSSAIFLIFLILIPAITALCVAPSADRIRLCTIISLSGIFFLSVLILLNDVLPFTGGGDDKVYLNASIRMFKDLGDWFDLMQFKQTHEQAGYPLLLTWVHQVSGDSLFHRKALNVFFFLLLAIVWFMIGNHIGGRRLAFVYATGVLLCTPLWYYWIFLLKDMTITLLQSLFLLGLVPFISQSFRMRSFGALALSTVAIIPFRSMLAFVNLAMLTCSTFLRPGSPNMKLGYLGKIVAVATIMVGVLIIGSQPEYLEILGVSGAHRSLDHESVQESLDFYEQIRVRSITNTLKFPLVYFMGEVAAFNPKAWGEMSSTLIRGVSMLPWIYLGVPLFFAGVWMTFSRSKETKPVESESVCSSESPATEIVPRSYLLLLLVFVAVYAVISWLTGNTTRWRLPSFPPMVAIAGYAWVSMTTSKRFELFLGWGLTLSVSLIIYYMVFK